MNTRSERRVSWGTPPNPRALLVGLALFALSSAAHADDPLAAYRDRFKLGMEQYKAGNMGEAIQYWEPIYREVGPQAGYRLSFDLARAYDQVGEATRAAERYQSFLDELGARRKAEATLEPIVLREEEEAKKRLDLLAASRGRIRVNPGARPLAAQVDLAEPRLGVFVSYVAPGSHVVTFAPGSEKAEKHTVEVKSGEIVEVAPDPEPSAPEPPAPPPEPPHAPGPLPPTLHATTKAHPFSPVFIVAGGAAAAVSTIAPILTYANARSIDHGYNPSSPTATETYSQYSTAKTTAYAMLSIPITLAAATGALTIWYFAGTKEVDLSTLTAGVVPARGGGAGVIEGRF
jgi:hypothetical protein